MMNNSIGLAFAVLQGPFSIEKIERMVSILKVHQTTPGRLSAVMWFVSREWNPQPALEAWVTRAFLGDPVSRQENTEQDEWTYFGNLIVRLYQQEIDPWSPNRTLYVSLFRRRGEPAYARLRDSDNAVPDDRIDTKRSSFTRDVANNVWHLIDDEIPSALVVSRLSSLVCWSDERIVEVSDTEKIVYRDHLRNVAFPALIPRSRQEHYDYVQHRMDL